MEEKKKNSSDNNSIISKLKSTLGINNKNVEFTAEYAWHETTYGRGSYRPIEERIAHKQKRIRERIEEHFRYCSSSETSIVAPSYYCLVSIESDISEHADEVFKPFIDNGFNVVKINEIEDDNVYVVSWKNIYSKKKTLGEGGFIEEIKQ